MSVSTSDVLATEPPMETTVERLVAVSATRTTTTAPATTVDLSDELDLLSRSVTRTIPVVPGLMIVFGLIFVVLAALPYQNPLGALAEYEPFFFALRVIAPVLFTLGFYLQARRILSGPFALIDKVLDVLNHAKPSQMKLKLEALDSGLSACRYGTSKSRPILLIAVSLLAYGVPVTVLSGVRVGGGLLFDAIKLDLILGTMLVVAPPMALFAGFVLFVWHSYQASRLREFRSYIVAERETVIGKMRILDNFDDRYIELSSLTEQVSELIKTNERNAESSSRLNGNLLVLGVILSAMISIVGILGAGHNLRIGATELDGNIISAILGVVVAAIITIQNTFRLAERAKFQRQIASDARKLLTELVYSVDTDDKLRDAVREYQRLSDRSVKDAPTEPGFQAVSTSGQGQSESARRTGQK
jgi:hypothetical protein